MGGWRIGNLRGGGLIVLFPELIEQVRQVRNVPVVMVERKVVEERNGGSV